MYLQNDTDRRDVYIMDLKIYFNPLIVQVGCLYNMTPRKLLENVHFATKISNFCKRHSYNLGNQAKHVICSVTVTLCYLQSLLQTVALIYRSDNATN